MKLRNLKFALNSAWQSFWRNLAVSLAAVLSITLILILAGVNLLVGHAFSQVVDGFRLKVSEISINVADGTPLSTSTTSKDQLRADPRVASVTFVTKDRRLPSSRPTRNNAVLATQIDGNPLDAKLEVRVIELKDVAAIDLMGRRWSGVDPTDPTNYQGDFVNRMLELSSWLGLAGIGLMVILVVVSVVIVMNTIRTAVYHRRKEIEVMKLVGATEWFVRGPFVIEGIMTGADRRRDRAVVARRRVSACGRTISHRPRFSSRFRTTRPSSRALLETCCWAEPCWVRSGATSAFAAS